MVGPSIENITEEKVAEPGSQFEPGNGWNLTQCGKRLQFTECARPEFGLKDNPLYVWRFKDRTRLWGTGLVGMGIAFGFWHLQPIEGFLAGLL
jgi:hypothetical protein